MVTIRPPFVAHFMTEPAELDILYETVIRSKSDAGLRNCVACTYFPKRLCRAYQQDVRHNARSYMISSESLRYLQQIFSQTCESYPLTACPSDFPYFSRQMFLILLRRLAIIVCYLLTEKRREESRRRAHKVLYVPSPQVQIPIPGRSEVISIHSLSSCTQTPPHFTEYHRVGTCERLRKSYNPVKTSRDLIIGAPRMRLAAWSARTPLRSHAWYTDSGISSE